MAIDAGGDLLSRGGAGEARGPFAVEPPHHPDSGNRFGRRPAPWRAVLATGCQTNDRYMHCQHV
jgi:hypothetical protein